MKVRSTKVRALIALPVIAVAAVGLSGCDTKVGAAAVVNADKISERTLSGYLTPQAKPIQASDGTSTPPRQFVLMTLVRNEVFLRLLGATGAPPSESEISKAKTQALQGGSEQQLTQNITATGLDASFTAAYLRQLELLTLLQTRVKTQADLDAAQKKAALDVAISPRYGSWDDKTLSINGLSKKQLLPLLTIDTPLPGDATPSPAASQ